MAIKTGITRVHITDKITGRGGQRFEESQKFWPVANTLYRKIFKSMDMTLLPGENEIKCTKEELKATYDYLLGIDVLLRPERQGECTMQEKFLFTEYETFTVEHCQDWLTLEPGDWFNCKAQYYFCGYAKLDRMILNPWVLADWGKFQRATAQNRIHWKLRGNDITKVGARASFMYVPFKEIPQDLIVISSERPYSIPMFTGR